MTSLGASQGDALWPKPTLCFGGWHFSVDLSHPGAVSQAFQGVQASQPHRDLVGDRAARRPWCSSGPLGVALPAGGQQQRHRPPVPITRVPAVRSRRAGPAPPAHRSDGEHDQRHRRDGPVRPRSRHEWVRHACCVRSHPDHRPRARKSSQSLDTDVLFLRRYQLRVGPGAAVAGLIETL
jgi:hypothetical protein